MPSKIMDSVMSMFSASGGAKTQQTQNPPGMVPPAGGNKTNLNKAPGSDGTQPPQTEETTTEDQSPLAEFSKLWDNETPDPKAKKELTVDDYLTFDPTKLTEITGKLDFTKGLDPAVLKKAQEGDSASFAAVMNHASRSSFAQALHAMSGVARQALKKQSETLMAQMPGEVRKQSTRAALAKNPLYSNPATQPLVQSLEAQIRAKHPDATPEDVTASVKKYFDGIVSLARGEDNSSSKKSTSPYGDDNIDWLKDFADVEEQQPQQ